MRILGGLGRRFHQKSRLRRKPKSKRRGTIAAGLHRAQSPDEVLVRCVWVKLDGAAGCFIFVTQNLPCHSCLSSPGWSLQDYIPAVLQQSSYVFASGGGHQVRKPAGPQSLPILLKILQHRLTTL